MNDYNKLLAKSKFNNRFCLAAQSHLFLNNFWKIMLRSGLNAQRLKIKTFTFKPSRYIYNFCQNFLMLKMILTATNDPNL